MRKFGITLDTKMQIIGGNLSENQISAIAESGGAGESHPHAPTDPYVSLSTHTAPLVQPT